MSTIMTFRRMWIVIELGTYTNTLISYASLIDTGMMTMIINHNNNGVSSRNVVVGRGERIWNR